MCICVLLTGMHKFVQHGIITPSKSGKSSTYRVSTESQLENQDYKAGFYALFLNKKYMKSFICTSLSRSYSLCKQVKLFLQNADALSTHCIAVIQFI